MKTASAEHILKAVTMVVGGEDKLMSFSNLQGPGFVVFWVEMGDFSMFQ